MRGTARKQLLRVSTAFDYANQLHLEVVIVQRPLTFDFMPFKR